MERIFNEESNANSPESVRAFPHKHSRIVLAKTIKRKDFFGGSSFFFILVQIKKKNNSGALFQREKMQIVPRVSELFQTKTIKRKDFFGGSSFFLFWYR